MQKVDMTIRYELGHSYEETWIQTNYHCPYCGYDQVWVEDHSGDYYTGPTHLCVACTSAFHLPSKPSPTNLKSRKDGDWQNAQRYEAITKAIEGNQP